MAISTTTFRVVEGAALTVSGKGVLGPLSGVTSKDVGGEDRFKSLIAKGLIEKTPPEPTAPKV